MTEKDLETLKYPIGKYKRPDTINAIFLSEQIDILEKLPALLKQSTSQLDEKALAFLHRPGGWTIKQLVHHIADSHMNAFIRVKLAITENNPTIKPYNENDWVKLADTTEVNINSSVIIIDGLHTRLFHLLKTLKPEEFQKTYFHPDHQRNVKIEEVVGLYAWHSNHHLAHIKQALQFKNQF